MSDTKIIFFDIDGTLLDFGKKKISEKTAEALHKLKENNIRICIATGRAPMEVPHFDGIEFDAFLTYNGSYCYNSKETIFSNPLPKEDIAVIMKNAAAMNRPISLATKDRLAANGKDQDLIDYYAIAGLEVEVADDFDKVAEEEVYQILAGSLEKERGQLMQHVKNAKIAAWWDRAVDIIPANGGKGVAVEKMLEYYHLDRAESMAFGDGNNDIEMLQAVEHGIAMANASDDLKKAATDQCHSAAEDGIYHYCVEHHLIEV